MQEIWLGLVEQQNKEGLQYDSGRTKASTYLGVSLRNGVRDYYRREWKKKEEPLLEGARTASGMTLDGWDSVPAVDGDPARLAQARELGILIPKVLRALPLTYSEAIDLCVLRDLEGYQAGETAGVRNQSTMRGRLHKARKRFRAEWAFRGLGE